MAINAYYHIASSSAGDASGDSWANAMGEAEFETHLESAVVAGDVHFVKDGTYTLDSAIDCSARDGSIISPIAIIGVKAATTNEGVNVVYTDWARDAADRPFFDCSSYQFKIGDEYILRNLSFQGEINNNMAFGDNCMAENCKFDCDGTGNLYSVNTSTSARFVNNEVTGAAGSGMATGANCFIGFNYLHDVNTQSLLNNGGNGLRCFFNVFDNGPVGVTATADADGLMLNNTFYECDKGMAETTGAPWLITNNIMEGNNTSGFSWTTQTDVNCFCNNHGDDARCTDMWSNVDTTTVFQDYGVTTGDPKFTTAGSDFSLQNDSPNLGAGKSIDLGVG